MQMQLPKANEIRDFLKSDRATLIVCIGVAFVFWLFTKLSQVYKSDVTLGINYELPEGKTFVESPANSLDVTLEGTGWELMFQNFNRKKQSIMMSMDQDSLQYVGYQGIKNKVDEMLESDLEVRNVNPEDLNLSIDEYIIKEIPVELPSPPDIVAQYQLASNNIIPEKISISGPASKVNEIDKWYTTPLKFKKIKSNIAVDVPLIAHPNKQVAFEPSKVKYLATIEQFTEKIVTLPIEIINSEDSIVILPNAIQLTCKVGLSDYETLDFGQIAAIVDVQDIDKEMPKQLPIEIVNIPEFLENRFSYYPEKVDYLLIKNQTN